MKNKKYILSVVVIALSLCLTGCSGVGQTDQTDTKEATEKASAFSLRAIASPAPVVSTAPDLFVESVVVEDQTENYELVKSYDLFSSILYDDLSKSGRSFALFFYQAENDRSEQMDTFFNRNLESLPNNTQILKVEWDKYVNLQTELEVRRPATMVFFGPDSEVQSTLLAPPIERIVEFFTEANNES